MHLTSFSICIFLWGGDEEASTFMPLRITCYWDRRSTSRLPGGICSIPLPLSLHVFKSKFQLAKPSLPNLTTAICINRLCVLLIYEVG